MCLRYGLPYESAPYHPPPPLFTLIYTTNTFQKNDWARVNIKKKFNFDLDRKSLDIIYTSFVCPLLEYGSGV